MGQYKKRKKYKEYDYESAYNVRADDMSEYFLEELLKKRTSGYVYATKEIRAGNQFEVEIYPDFLRPKDIPRAPRTKLSTKSQSNLNDRKSRNEFERKLNANFRDGDLWITHTYDEDNLPGSIDEAQKNMKRYIERLRYQRKKRGLPAIKYLYVTEWISEDGECVRCHHHMVMDGLLDMDIVQKVWKYGKRSEVRRIDYSKEHGLNGLANYMTKVMTVQRRDRKSIKMWKGSQNLINPVSKKNHYKFPKHKVREMVKNQNLIRTYLEKQYPEYAFEDTRVCFNEINCLFYIYSRMRCREDEDDGKAVYMDR